MSIWSKNEQLCQLVQQGDNDALEELYTNNIRFIKMFCRRLSRNEIEYDELQQEAFFILRNCAMRFNPDFGFKFISYFGKALSRCISKRRYPNEILILDKPAGDSVNNNLIDFILDENAIDPQEQSALTNLQGIVLDEFNRMCGDTKRVLELHYLKGYTFEQIGQMLGISIHQVRAILIHGRNMLFQNSNLRRLYQSWFNVNESELLRKKY